MPLLYEIIVLELRHRARQNVAPAGHSFAAFVSYNSRMNNKTLIVKKKNVYGNELIYPVCQNAILFSCIAGSKTFCSTTIANIKKLGYKFETQSEEI